MSPSNAENEEEKDDASSTWVGDTQVFVQDTKSLGGTFLNDRRLAATGKESPPVRIKHGDVLQFGVDYRPSQPNQQRKRFIFPA